jgi:hypothetical protein
MAGETFFTTPAKRGIATATATQKPSSKLTNTMRFILLLLFEMKKLSSGLPACAKPCSLKTTLGS